MAVSIYDVAEKAGVSISTVSRILNHSASVSEEKVQAVMDAMKELEYEPNQFARGLVKQTSNLIGVYLQSMAEGELFKHSYSLEVLSGIEKVLSYQNYSMVLLTEAPEYGFRANKVPKYLKYVRQKKIDGLIITSISENKVRDKAFEEILSQSYPMVYIGKRFHQKGINVYAQFVAYNIEKLRILYRLGHRRIMTNILHTSDEYQRKIVEGAREEMPDLELRQFNYVFSRENRGHMKNDLKSLIEDQGYTAICTSDIASTQLVYSICSELNISIPGQLSILATEHRMSEGADMTPPVSAFYVPAREMGMSAARLLLMDIKGEEMVENSVEFESVYRERESVCSVNQ